MAFPGVKEKDVRLVVKQWLQWHKWFVFYNLQGLGCYPGIPDLVAIKKNHVVYIELKRPGVNTLRKKQEDFKNDLTPHLGENVRYIIAHGIEDLSELEAI